MIVQQFNCWTTHLTLDNYICRGYSAEYGYNKLNPTSYTSCLSYSPCLSSGERHGYGIMKQVEIDSQGNVSMGAGTLYGSLKRMLDAGLVEESDKRVDPVMDDERRIYYRITGVGAKALEAELERYKRIVTVAQERKLLPKNFTI